METRPTPPARPAPSAAAKKSSNNKWAKIAVFALSLYPLARLIALGFFEKLGANPVEFVTRSTGLWALAFLCLTLAITPARKIFNANGLIRFRRMLGLFCFFYATLHLATYVWLDQWFDWAHIARDIAKRPFIWAGFSAFVVLLALAATSPKAAVRKMGRNWGRLHKAIYLAAALAILHFWWMKAGKHDFKLPIVYGAILSSLLAWRAGWWLQRRLSGPKAPAPPRERAAAKTLR